MTATLTMIRRIHEITSQRNWLGAAHIGGFPTRFDIRLGRLMCYLRHRHFRDSGLYSPI